MHFKNKRVFVSGGSGVIGHALVDYLLGLGAHIFVGDLKPMPEKWYSKIKYRQGDLNNMERWELDNFDPEYFFHLAATFERSEETFEFWQENIHHNINLSSHLMKLMKGQSNLKRVVFASSYLIFDKNTYCSTEKPLKPIKLSEDHIISPRNLCGSAKLHHEIELDFLSSSTQTNFTAVCARIYRSYGLHSRDIISRWIRMAIQKETLSVFGEESLFDYIFAGDVAEGLLRLAESSCVGVFNLGRGNARCVSDVIELLKKHFPDILIKENHTTVTYEASEADMSKMNSVLGWTPHRDIEDTIPEMIVHERKNLYNEVVKSDFSVLISSASQKISCIEAAKKAHQKTFTQITEQSENCGKIITADSSSRCLAQYFSDDFWHMPILADLSIDKLISYCEDNNIRAIIPTRDGELTYFSLHRPRLQTRGIYVMVSELKAVEKCLDKQLFYDVLSDINMPVIQTVTDVQSLLAERFVVKERFGAGSMTILIDGSREQALEHSRKLKKPIFQPFIVGTEYSVDMYIDRKNKVKGGVVRERTLVIDGESQVTTTVHHEKILELCEEASLALKLYGHVIWQVIEDKNNELHIIECNPRFGGASSASLSVGLDSFYWFIQEILNENIDHIDFVRNPNNIRQIRYPGNEYA